jgi:hypothetical protein
MQNRGNLTAGYAQFIFLQFLSLLRKTPCSVTADEPLPNRIAGINGDIAPEQIPGNRFGQESDDCVPALRMMSPFFAL